MKETFVTVTKEMTFDAGHILEKHDGKCKNLHGHTYRLRVSVTGPLIDGGAKEGMVIDFTDLKALINDYVMDKYDHAFIAKGDENALKFAMASGYKYHILGVRTTVENLAPTIHKELQAALEQRYAKYVCWVSEVKIWETPNSSATFSYQPK